MDTLPNEFDIIVVGTGFVESIVAAAASRVGKRVLHIDSNDYYGGVWASFNLESLQNFPTNPPQKTPKDTQINLGESTLPIGNQLFTLKNFTTKWHISTDETENDEDKAQDENSKQKYTPESILKDSRKFNLDLIPKLQFARGALVDLLITSNIARYSEFRSVSRVLTYLNGKLEIVPCSRSDVFANDKISVIEKRILMKIFLAICNDQLDPKEYESKTFHGFLKDRKLSPNLIHYILYAISMSDDKTGSLQGIANTKRFLNSLGRFGKTPLLYSMYGSGEIAQAFCRLCAVFGGIYALNQNIHTLVFDDQKKFQGIICDEQRIRAKTVVLSVDKAPKSLVKSKTNKYIARAIFITDKSVMDSEKEHLTLLIYPPHNYRNPCILIESGTLTGTCPKNLYIVHLISRQVTNPIQDFEVCAKNLFETPDSPNILWSCYFSIPDTNDLEIVNEEFSNVFLCPGPDMDLDYDNSVQKAKDIFKSIYPDEEFLPRAPDPEEIVIESVTGDEDEIPENAEKNDDPIGNADN